MGENISLDLVIPTYLPDAKLDSLLERMQKQSMKPNRIILINTIVPGKEDTVEKYVEQYGVEVYSIPQSEFDHGATRAYGASLSDADYIMFMTQDAVPRDSHLIEELMRGMENESVGACYARQLVGKSSDVVEAFTRDFNYPEHDIIKSKEDIETMGIKAFFCSDVCAVYRKSAYNSLGGFVKRTIFNEDMIMAYKMFMADYKVMYVSKAQVIHAHHFTYMQQFRRNFDLGVSHQEYKEIFKTVKSEKEGIRLVKETASYLAKNKQYLMIIHMIIMSGFKFMGYKLGFMFKKLPKSVIMKCTGSKWYWQDRSL